MQTLRLRTRPANTLTPLRAACCALALSLPLTAAAEPAHRSKAAVNAFKRTNACPSTAAPRGPCPGWIVDHIIPLCAGGPDTPRNMQWQTVADAKAKDVHEHAQCRRLRNLALAIDTLR